MFEHEWIKISIVFALAALFSFVSKKIYTRLCERLKKTHFLWDEALVRAVYLPLNILIWLLAISSATRLLVEFGLLEIQRLVAVFCFIWGCVRFVTNLEEAFNQSQKVKYDRTTVRAVSQLAKTFALVIGTLIIMQTLGLSISAVLAFGGAGALAVALAAKDMLGNFFGGLMIFLDRPFAVGDWIRSPDRDIEGFVEHIGWRLTRIRTFDKRPLYIPNGVLSTISVQNPSRMSNRQIKTHIGIRYADSDKLCLVVQKMREYLKECPYIDQDKLTMVYFDEFADSALNIFVYTFTKTTVWKEYKAQQEEIFLKFIDIIKEAGADMAFPTRTLHVHHE